MLDPLGVVVNCSGFFAYVGLRNSTTDDVRSNAIFYLFFWIPALAYADDSPPKWLLAKSTYFVTVR